MMGREEKGVSFADGIDPLGKILFLLTYGISKVERRCSMKEYVISAIGKNTWLLHNRKYYKHIVMHTEDMDRIKRYVKNHIEIRLYDSMADIYHNPGDIEDAYKIALMFNGMMLAYPNKVYHVHFGEVVKKVKRSVKRIILI